MKNVGQLLKSKPHRVVAVSPDDTVLEAIKTLAAYDVGAVMVVEGEKLVGIMSERDYTRKVVLQGRHSDSTRVKDVMTENVICVSPRSSARDCMGLMSMKGIRHLPVIENGKAIGMVSIRDIVDDIIADQEFTISQLEQYISGQ
jgi:CBS domain-containing protein